MTTDSTIGGPSGPAAGDGPMRLLDQYRAGRSFFFSSPRGSMLAHGVDATVPKIASASRHQALLGQVHEFLESAQNFGRATPMLVGAVPFSESLPAHLVLPSEVVRTGALPVSARRYEPSAVKGSYDISTVPTPAEFEREIVRALRRVDRGEAGRVVLARLLELRAQGQICANDLLRNLALGAAGGYTFAVDLPVRGEDGSRDSFGAHPQLARTLLGTSPELLLSRNGKRVTARAVTGAVARSDDPSADQRQAASLLESAAKLTQHDADTEFVADTLNPWCADLDIPDSPSVVCTATAWHLVTDITGQVRDDETTSLELALALHPSPSACGAPVDEARSVIREAEPFDRGYFAGFVGWCDTSGDGEWTMATRCGEIEDGVLRLYAAADVAAGTEPAAEVATTGENMRMLLSAMGLSHAAG